MKSSLACREQSLFRTSREDITWKRSVERIHLERVDSNRSVTASSLGSSSWTSVAMLDRMSKPIWFRLDQDEFTHRRTNLIQVRFLASSLVFSSSKLRFL